MKLSSSVKVGILTLLALCILVFSIMWIKGRSLSSSERITVEFKDVNGMRAGSAVQIMGFRVGQVEEVIPVINGENSFVKVKFVITEPNVDIPYASEISIQQSGLIGEQFLEVTPPKDRVLYIPVTGTEKVLKKGNDVEMLLSKEFHNVGVVKNVEIIRTETLPRDERINFSTEKVYKITYIINMPGLVIPDAMKARILPNKHGGEKMRIAMPQNEEMALPDSNLKYTVVEPMRLVDFMELQYRSAKALEETNLKISAILSPEVITDLQETANNINVLTYKANNTVDKADMLIDTSKAELLSLTNQANKIADNILAITDSVAKLTGDKEFATTMLSTTKSVGRLSDNVSKVLEDPNTKQTLDNITVMSKNMAEISGYVNDMSKDEQLKQKVLTTVDKLDLALEQLNTTLLLVNDIGTNEKDKIVETINDANEASKNVKKFSEKLNKRFLLFRLMF